MRRWRLDMRDVLLVVAVALFVDVALSFFGTCYVESYQPQPHTNNHQDCGPFGGPIFVALRWFFSLDANPIIAAFTFVLAISTIALWLATHKAANAARDSAIAAKQAADIAYVDQRPWVNIRAEIAGPLTYEAGVWSIPTKYCLQNLGKTPATNVAAFGNMVPFTIAVVRPGEMAMPGTNVSAEMETVCSFPEGMTAADMGWGIVLFPREQKRMRFGLRGNQQLFDQAKESPGFSGQFLMVFCVAYGSTFDSSKYRTAKAFHLYKRSGGRIDIEGETIPGDKLNLTLSPVNGSHAR